MINQAPQIAQPAPVAQMGAQATLDAPSRISTEQPRPVQAMTTDPLKLRGGGEGEAICCGCCAACCACEAFECFECCKGLCGDDDN